MIEATNLKNGTTFLMDGKPFKVIKYTHQKIGRGGGLVKLVVRNLESGSQVEKTINSAAKVEDINTQKKSMQYLYSDDKNAVFMDPKTFGQVEIPTDLAREELSYIKEGENADILFWDDRPLSIEILPKVTLKVVDTAPGVKGNSATNLYKSATLENDLQLKVPLFIKIGDKIRVDTRKGEYVERISDK
ncbi:elongation factor P [Patescibacteria group bacterium]|nr:elongation factor P [Patescibacteria group bacterium]MBU0777138.1 elongation factor P [Patescibacteria group bacterium]MBU0845832.1 elongation factor P [Patescibacteria group bacterium]MBU0922859.1 elongation factor P [Patescibacteria group bacterium]MBU1066408.1 elongation factor P [Patescibacteria group bacterium]